MNVQTSLGSQNPRLEQVLSTLQQKSCSNIPPEFSSSLSSRQIDGIRNLLELAHGGIERKSGGWYLEEHIAAIGEIALQLSLPPYAVVLTLLHDFVEDNDNALYPRKFVPNSKLRNFGKLEQQLFPNEEGVDFTKLDKRVIMSGVTLATKPDEVEVREFNFGNNFLNSDKRFAAKMMRALQKSPYEGYEHFEDGTKITPTSRFYTELTLLFDMFLNSNFDEKPNQSLSRQKKVSFNKNKIRNAQRLVYYVPLLDSKIREYSILGHCCMDNLNYENVIGEMVFPRVLDGIRRYGNKFTNNSKELIKDFNDYVNTRS
ncbi:MAG: hypothetical protein ACLFPL_02675 [Candidatus Nanoarchaeia archaeon]